MPDNLNNPVPGDDGAEKNDNNQNPYNWNNDNNELGEDEFVPYFKEWETLYDMQKMEMNVSEDHPFGMILKLKYAEFIDPKDDLNIARLFVGIKDPQKNYKECIELGLYMGRLYIKDIFDTFHIKKENLVEGIYMVLAVDPLSNGRCITTLMALDLSGVLLTKININRLYSTDWNGGISTGAHFKSLRIEGFQSKYVL